MFVCVVVCVVFDTGYFARGEGGWWGGGTYHLLHTLGVLEDFYPARAARVG